MTLSPLENYSYEGCPRTGFVYIRESVTGRRIASVLGRGPDKIMHARRFAAVPVMTRALQTLLAADIHGDRRLLNIGHIITAMDDAAAALHCAEHGIMPPSPPLPRIEIIKIGGTL